MRITSWLWIPALIVAPLLAGEAADNAPIAEVIELPEAEKSASLPAEEKEAKKETPPALKPIAPVRPPAASKPALEPDDGLRAEVVPLPPVAPVHASPAPKRAAPHTARETAAPAPPPASGVSREPGWPTVLSGRLAANLELGPANCPILVRGNFVIPAGVVLKIKAGAVIVLQGDPKQEKPAQAGNPDPTQSGVIWVWGRLAIDGVSGNPVEITADSKEPGTLLLYGSELSSLSGLRLKNLAVAQNGGTCLWTNCEIIGARHYALASGIGLFTHCTFRNCGGVFATYDAGPWSLLLRKSIFDACREAVVLGSDPGEARLVVERNHFLRTSGAHLRVLPIPSLARRDAKAKSDREFLIGENWYGVAAPEEVDLRIVDCRTDPALKARLNTRPPAEQPYKEIGAGVAPAVLRATLQEQQAIQERLLRAHSGAPGAQNLSSPLPETPATAAKKR